MSNTSTGFYELTFAEGMDDANYSVNVTLKNNTNHIFAAHNMSTSSFQVSGQALVANNWVNLAFSVVVTGGRDSALVPEGLTVTEPMLAKAWLRYDATTQTIVDSYNIASVSYVEAGKISVTFSNEMDDANYVITNASRDSAIAGPDSGTVTTTGFTYITRNIANTKTDFEIMGFTVFD